MPDKNANAGLFSRIRSAMAISGAKSLSATPQALQLVQSFGGEFFAVPRSLFIDGTYIQAQQASYSALYAMQPNVRTVVDFLAMQIVAPSLDMFERESDGGKHDASDQPAADTMRHPNDWQGQREFLLGIAKDYLIYENAYVWIVGPVEDDRKYLVRVPPYAMGVKGSSRLKPTGYRVTFRDGTFIDLENEQVIHWRGFSGVDPRVGTSKMETLRSELVEAATRQAQSTEFWKSGAVRGGIIKRPVDAPEWSDTARERFEEAWAARSKGINLGRSPVLEEGMDFVDAGVTPREAELIAARELSLAVCARVYGLHPALFGIMGEKGGGADLKAARDAAESDTAAPLRKLLAEALTVQLASNTYLLPPRFFFDFGGKQEVDMASLFVAAKNATNGAVVTVNEFRRLYLNLPPIEGGDEMIVVPGATTAGGAPPGTTATGAVDGAGRPAGVPGPTPAKADDDIRTKAAEMEAKALSARRDALKARRDDYAAEHAKALRKHFRRQEKSSADIDAKRWDEELTADLNKLATKTVDREGAVTALRLGGEFDGGQVVNYLAAGAERVAANINATTAKAIKAARASAEDADAAERGVWDDAVHNRADGIGISRATALAAFAAVKAAEQNSEPNRPRVKTWVWSGLGERHSDLDGSTVEYDSTFDNGLAYPGDPSGDAHENARCQCLVDVH